MIVCMVKKKYALQELSNYFIIACKQREILAHQIFRGVLIEFWPPSATLQSRRLNSKYIFSFLQTAYNCIFKWFLFGNVYHLYHTFFCKVRGGVGGWFMNWLKSSWIVLDRLALLQLIFSVLIRMGDTVLIELFLFPWYLDFFFEIEHR